jgi:hypothetical protein
VLRRLLPGQYLKIDQKSKKSGKFLYLSARAIINARLVCVFDAPLPVKAFAAPAAAAQSAHCAAAPSAPAAAPSATSAAPSAPTAAPAAGTADAPAAALAAAPAAPTLAPPAAPSAPRLMPRGFHLDLPQ